MAITTTTISINPGWASSSLVTQLESAFTWLGLHGGSDSGIVIGVSTFTSNAGGTVGSTNNDYADVPTTSVSGIGTGLTLDILRNSGVINEIFVNRPGYGYTGGEVVRVSAADIGGSANGAADFDVIVSIAATVTGSISYACTFSSVSGSSWIINGQDRNGNVGGANTTITIKEGDVLTIRNSYGYYVGISRTSTGGYEYIQHVKPFNSSHLVQNNQTLTFAPAPGQAGTYWIDDGYSDYLGGRVIVLPADSADINPVGYGTTSSFYYKRLSGSGHNSAGVLKQVIDPNKRYGTTYRGFMLYDDGSGRYDWVLNAGSGFHPYPSNFNNFYFGGMAKPLRWVGSAGHDAPYRPTDNNNYNSLDGNDYVSVSRYGSQSGPYERIPTGSNTGYKLDLNVFRSQLDPNFAVLSYRASTLSSQRISDNTFGTFILHNFTSNIWDLNDVFLSGYTQIISATSGTGNFRPNITFRSYISGNMDKLSSVSPSRRAAEFGYSQLDSWAQYPNAYVDDIYYSTAFVNADIYNYTVSNTSKRIYYRSASQSPERGLGGYGSYNRQISSNADFNAVIKGIPLNGQLVPIPYYLPDDFALIEFSYNLPGVNIQQGDTITVSPSEVYTVITGSYNQRTKTSGILFCARVV